MQQPRNAQRRMKLPELTLIIGALGSGVLLFLGVAVYLQMSGSLAPPEGVTASQDLTPVLLGVAALAAVSGLTVFRLISAKAAEKLAVRREAALAELTAGEVPPELAQRTILGGALSEGVALLGVVTYLIEGSPLAFVPIGLGLLGVGALLPSRDRLAEFVSRAGRGPG